MLKKGEVKMIHQMIKEGLSKSAIARKLGLSRDTVANTSPVLVTNISGCISSLLVGIGNHRRALMDTILFVLTQIDTSNFAF